MSYTENRSYGQSSWEDPMSGAEFAYRHAAKLQEFELTDRNQLAEAAQNQRAMQRDTHKSELRILEADAKEKRKAKTMQISQTEDGVQLYFFNGKNELLRIVPLFEFSMVKLLRFRRDGEDGHFWQAVLQVGKKEIFTYQYAEDVLKSISKLQTTSFAGFDETVATGDRNIAWKWLQKKLISLFEKAEETMLPSLPGWFQKDGVWHFWTLDSETDLFASPSIRQFSVNSLQPKNISELIDELIAAAHEADNMGSFSVLLIYRLLALLVRLIVAFPPPMGLVLVGKDATEQAEMLLSTIQKKNSSIIINLETDRKNVIRNNVFFLQDTSALFVSSGLHTKSIENRLLEILSWLDAGFMEEKRITFPFVFCVPELSTDYLKNGMIVVQTEGIPISTTFSAFAKLQSFVILQVESCGEYWATELTKQYDRLEKEINFEDRGNILHFARTVVTTVSKMLDVQGEQKEQLQEIFTAGIDEMEYQISSDFCPMLEIFREGVIKLIDTGDLSVVDSKNPVTDTKIPLIYFNSDYYCFTGDVLEYICEQNGLDLKSILFFKQQLDDLGMIKKYRKTGERPSELSVDISLGFPVDRKVSVLAIRREFWDEIGGVALYERGE